MTKKFDPVLEGLGVELLSREARIKKHGIDCGEGLHWHGWEPGGDYLKKLIVKNVSGKMLKIKYKLPAAKFFYLEFPETIILSPGMTFTINVNFRPIVKKAYADYIQFYSSEGSFYMPVWATLPRTEVDHVQSLDFGFCSVNEETLRTFTLTNSGDLLVNFSWKFEAPLFRLTPAQGSIEPGDQVDITVGFNPTNASALEAAIECAIAGGEIVTRVEVAAISKFPFISFSNPSPDFREVLTGTRKEIDIRLKNQSLVPATFNMIALENDHDPVFFIKPTSGVVPPNSELPLRVVYAPNVSGSQHTDNFTFETPGGNNAKLTCKGLAAAPNVFFNTTGFSFGDVVLGEKKSTELTITNDSDAPCRFEFVQDDLSSFRAVPSCGTIPPKLHINVNVTFKPKACINYYKRFFCNILNMNKCPVYIDLVGTCYDNKASRPQPLELEHVARYREAIARTPHLRRTSAEELLETLPDDYAVTEEAPESVFNEYFIDSCPAEDNGECSILEEVISFGSCMENCMSEFKTITIKNHTSVKMTVQWDIDDASGDGNTTKTPLFSVMPISQDVKANSTVEFKVSMLPRKNNYYYAQRLECYAYPKSQRTFRLVNMETFVPPLKLHTMCMGHTFPVGAQHFMQQAVFSVPQNKLRGLECTGCTNDSSVYMTIAITNKGDTPILYQFPEPSDPMNVFRVSPPCGLIKRNRFQLVCVRFSPKQAEILSNAGDFSHVFDCILNCNHASPYALKVCGRGYSVDIEFETGNNLFFKPTCRGMLSRRQHAIRNKTRVPVTYRWDVPRKFQNILKVNPMSGVLQGNELLPMTWEFMPNEIKAFNCRVPCFLATNQGNTKHESRTHLNVKGNCTSGVIEFDPPLVEFDTTQICGQGGRNTFLLKNSSDCTLRYRLAVKLTSPMPNGQPVTDDAAELTFDMPTGEVHARSHKKITVTFAPSRPHFHSYTVICTFGDASVAPDPNEETHTPRRRGKNKRGSRKKKGSKKKGSKKSRARREIETARRINGDTQDFQIVPSDEGFSQTMECQIKGTGGFPLVCITDCRIVNAADMNRGLLDIWKTLNIDAINAELLSPLTEAETDLNSDGLNSKITSFKAGDLVPVLKNFEYNLGVGPANGPPDVSFLRFKNVGDLNLHWTVKFPEDMEVALNHWADTGDPTRQQRWQQAIADQGLFLVEPRHGTIKPGETCLLAVTYFHKFVGKHELPVILHINKGKHICLNLVGATLPSMPPVFSFSHLPSDPRTDGCVCRLEDIPLCLATEEVPVQVFPLTNHSQLPVSYSVDLSSFEAAKNENYGVNVWSCLNPEGTVEAGEVGYLRLLFQPIEAKTERLPVHITMTGGGVSATQTVVFVASGYVLTGRKDESGDAQVYEVATQEAIDNTSFPSKQQLAIPGQLARPSSDYLYFGDLQPFACSEHAVTIENICAFPLAFEWLRLPQKGSVPDASETVSMTFKPKSGIIPANGKILIRIRLDAGCRPVVLDRDVVCKVRIASAANEDDDGLAGTMRLPLKNVAHKDTYGYENIPCNTSRLSVTKALSGREKIHGTRKLSKTQPKAKDDTERLLNSAMGLDDEEDRDRKHITQLARRESDSVHLRIVARVRTLNHLERQDNAQKNHVRSPDVTEEPDIAMRTFVPIRADAADGSAPSTDAGHLEAGRKLMERLVQDTLNDSAVLQAFDELLIPPIPNCDGVVVEEEKAPAPMLSEGQQDEQRSINDAQAEFQTLSESLLTQTIFNLMQESMHGMFDVTALPRQIVTKGFRVKEGVE